MKFKSLACTGISFFSLLQPIVSLSATKQPNILFFMVDDMGDAGIEKFKKDYIAVFGE